MILPHVLTKDGAAFMKETLHKKYTTPTDNFKKDLLVEFVQVKAEIELFIEQMKERNEDLYHYNYLMDKYTVLKQLYEDC